MAFQTRHRFELTEGRFAPTPRNGSSVLGGRRALGVLLLLLIALMLVPVAAIANFGGTKSDDSTLSYYWGTGLSSAWKTQISQSLINDVAPTDVDVLEVSYLHTGAMADVSILPDDLPVGFGGTWQCFNWTSGGDCKHGHAVFDTDPSTTAVKAHLACHELGHSLGLTHRGSGYTCMRDATNDYTNYDSHDRSHINGHY